MVSGISGSHCILSSMAKVRVQSGLISSAEVLGSKGSYIAYFLGKAAECEDEHLALSSSRQPFEPRVFKSIDGAVAELNRIGITETLVKIVS